MSDKTVTKLNFRPDKGDILLVSRENKVEDVQALSDGIHGLYPDFPFCPIILFSGEVVKGNVQELKDFLKDIEKQ